MESFRKLRNNENFLAYCLLFPSLLLLLVLIGYPIVYNLYISVFKVPINPLKPSKFVGLKKYLDVLSDPDFYSALGITVVFTVCVTTLSTVFGLAVALLFNRPFRGKKLANAIVIASYVIPGITLIYANKYMFNSIYGIVNYYLVNVLHIFSEPPLWFDNGKLSFIVAVVFFTYRYFPYAYMSFHALLQSIDKTLYEAASLDGANAWERFKAVTYPAIKPVLATVVSLRTIWVLYTYADLNLLTSRVRPMGVYLYETAFSIYDFGKASAISVIFFVLVFSIVFALRKVVFRNDE